MRGFRAISEHYSGNIASVRFLMHSISEKFVSLYILLPIKGSLTALLSLNIPYRVVFFLR